VMAGHLNGHTNIRSVLARQMERPLFPVPLQTMGCNLDFHDFDPGESFELDDGVSVQTAPLNHPDGATGYRIGFGGHSVAYVTDTEHWPDRLDANILALARAAGVGRLVLFHHEPDHDDQAMLRIEAQAQALLPATVAAREGATLVLE